VLKIVSDGSSNARVAEQLKKIGLKVASMAKVRKHMTDQYSMKANTVSQDKRLSFKARGLFDYMWSMPDDWNFTVASLARDSDKDGKDAVTTALKELEQLGYLDRKRIRVNQTGKFTCETEYNLFDDPNTNDGFSDLRTNDGFSDLRTNDGFSKIGKPANYINKHTSKENKRDILLLQNEVSEIYDAYIVHQDEPVVMYLKKEKDMIVRRIMFNLDVSIKNIKRYVTTCVENEVRKYHMSEELPKRSTQSQKVFTSEERAIAHFDWQQALNE